MLNNNKFTFVNVCFQHKRNEEIGLYGQTLIIKINEKDVISLKKDDIFFYTCFKVE